MVDVDDFLAGDISSFNLVIGRAYALGSLSIEDHRLLSEWAGCYRYIFPAEREQHQMLFQEIAWHFWQQNTFWVGQVGIRFEHLTVMYTLEEQYQIFLLIESKIHATLPG